MTYKPSLAGIALSDSLGAGNAGAVFADANFKASARGSFTPIYADVSVNTTGYNIVLTQPIVPAGGIITTGSNTFSAPTPLGDGNLFDYASAGAVTFTAPVMPISLNLFSPKTDGVTETINAWNRWANSCSVVGASFEGIPGLSLHTDPTVNKFALPTVRRAKINLQGTVVDSTIVKSGPYQDVKYPVVAGQCRLVVSVTGGPGFTVGEQIRVGNTSSTARFPTDGLGYVLAWNGGTNVLNAYASAPFYRGAATITITGLSSGTTATVSSVGYQLGFCAEVLWCIYCENHGMQVFNGYDLYGFGQSGTNTDGTTTPTVGYAANKVVVQNSEFYGPMGMGAGDRGFVLDCANSNSSFCNNNNFYSLSPLFTYRFGLDIQNNSSYNTFPDIDVESNCYLKGNEAGAALVNVVSLNNRFPTGLLDGAPTGIPTIAFNYGLSPSENFQTYVGMGLRMTSPPIGNALTMIARLAYSPTAENIIGLMDGYDISGGRAGLRNSGQTNLIGYGSNVPLGRVVQVIPADSKTNWVVAADLTQWLHLTNGFPIHTEFMGFAASGGIAGDIVSIPDFRFDMCQTTAGTKFGALVGSAPTVAGGTWGTAAMGMACVGLSGADSFVADTIQFNGTGPNYTVYQTNDSNHTAVIVGVATPIAAGATYTTGAHGSGTVSWSAQHACRLSSLTNVVAGHNITALTWAGSSTGLLRSLIGNIAFIDGVTQGTIAPTVSAGVNPPEQIKDNTTSTTVNLLNRKNRLFYVDSVTGLNMPDSCTAQTTGINFSIGALGCPYFGGLNGVGDPFTTPDGGSGTINNAAALANVFCFVFTMAQNTTLTIPIFKLNDTSGSILTPLG